MKVGKKTKGEKRPHKKNALRKRALSTKKGRLMGEGKKMGAKKKSDKNTKIKKKMLFFRVNSPLKKRAH